MIIRPNRPFAPPADTRLDHGWPGQHGGEAYGYPPPQYGYEPEWEHGPRRRPGGLKRLIMIVVIVGGAVAISVATFVAVAAWELATSREARMLTQAARDSAHSVALDASNAARCQRETSEARAANRPPPACATQSAKPKADPGVTGGDLLDAMVKVALD